MICFLSILLYVPTAPGDTAKGIKKGPKEETEEIFTPKLVKVILRIIIIGSFLDTFGDTGNRFARSTIMTNRFTQDPENARNPNLQFVFLLSNLAAVMIGVQLVSQTWKKLGLPLWACIGNLVSSVTQFVLIFVIGPPGSGAMWWFFSIWFCSQCFGFTSSMATRLMIPMITPAETRGQWTSYFAAGASLSGLVAPLMLAGIYDKFGPTSGNFVGPEVCLTMCGSISFVAFLIFTPLFGLWPKDVLGKVVPTNVEDLEYYDKMHWREFEKLDHEIKLYVHEMCVKAGRVWSKQTHWGDYKDDVADMEGLRKRSLKQFFDTAS
ncbi:unnamed protein product [Polarella glacialis]|uniref:Major facilitator superfamily (MFS) profile domain-containing protein n=1 Tax=Polarella glacialis TaxID=89957 RepID=A0A813J0Z8_POLGL|nr:unnamed protein product [Polarella glacialis]